MYKKLFPVFILFFLSTFNYSHAQGSSLFSVSGGPIFGWHLPQINDLNSELKKIGFPEISTSGQFITGAGGYIDVPFVKGLKIGGLGMGYSSEESAEYNNYVNAVSIKFRMGGISIEYLKRISDKFDYSIGSIIGLGSFRFNVHRYPKEYQNWSIGNFGIDTSGVNNLKQEYSKNLYIFQPQLGIGFQATKFLYLKLNAGYMFTISDEWKLNEILKVGNVPSGIKADGFSVNFGINLGLFVN